MNQKTLHEYAKDFIDTKRAAGMLYKSGEYGLNRYLKYHEKEFNDCTYPTKESVHGYFGTFANLYCSITSPVIDFCKYLRYLDIPAYVYRSKIIIPQARAPYIISDSEGEALFRGIDAISPDDTRWKGKEKILPAFFRLMWCCGTRTKESRVLLCENVNLSQGYIDILNPKNKRDRRIFLSNELTDYFAVYNSEMDKIRPNRLYFFPGKKDNNPVSVCGITQNYSKCWYKAFPEFDRTINIRPYDFRHHFVYANLNRWLEEGKDINSMIYYLMQVTGHKNIQHLLYYFHLSPDIYEKLETLSKDLDLLLPETYYLEEEEE